MRRKGYSQKQTENEVWASLPDEVKGYIEKYLDDPIISTEEMVAFAKSGVGLKIISLIVQYGKMCAKNERKRSSDRSQEQIDKIRSILNGGCKNEKLE